MRYLNGFDLPTLGDESEFVVTNNKFDMTCYTVNNAYPFHIFPQKGLSRIEFSPITIFCGGNGSGKSTLLNVIAEKLGISRSALFNSTPFFTDYLRMCRAELAYNACIPRESRIITSDDVFDFLLDLRHVNQGIDKDRNALFEEWKSYRDGGGFQMSSLSDYDELKKRNKARHTTRSAYAHRYLPDELKGASNGESAFAYFTDKIRENALYLLDEPENSLSVQLQVKLADYLEESVRFYNCQLVISTHSPILLALKGARVYDLDANPVCVKSWTEIDSVRTWRGFFEEHRGEF